jgi:hypothetical protein
VVLKKTKEVVAKKAAATTRIRVARNKKATKDP